MSETIALNSVIAARWSPRAYLDRAVEAEKLQSLFEAARWASSCFNEQPWRFVTATRDNPAEFEKVLGILVEANRKWVQGAWLAGFTVAKRTFTHNGAANRFGLHDAGAAGATLAIQATALGLQAHFMGGFDAARARAEFGVPEDFEVGAAFAVGYPVEFDPPAARQRRGIEEIVFGTKWGSVAKFVR